MADKNIKLKDGDNVLYPQVKVENIVDLSSSLDNYTTLSVPITGWNETTLEDETCYTLALSLNGATQGKHPIISCIPSKPSLEDDEEEAFSLVFKAVEQTDSLVLYSSEVPTVAYTLQVKNY